MERRPTIGGERINGRALILASVLGWSSSRAFGRVRAREKMQTINKRRDKRTR